MSKVLKFTDGTSKEFTDSSTILSCVTVVKTYAEVDALRTLFQKSLTGATFDGTVYPNVLPVACDAKSDGNGNITVTFTNREKTTAEVQAEQITELQQAIADLTEAAATASEGGTN